MNWKLINHENMEMYEIDYKVEKIDIEYEQDD